MCHLGRRFLRSQKVTVRKGQEDGHGGWDFGGAEAWQGRGRPAGWRHFSVWWLDAG